MGFETEALSMTGLSENQKEFAKSPAATSNPFKENTETKQTQETSTTS